MRKLSLVFAAMMAMLISMGAMAATANTAPAGFKVGIVDVRQVLQASPQVAAMQSKLRSEFGAREKEIQTAQQALQKDADNLNRNNAVMSANDRTALTQKVQGEQQKLREMQLSFQKDVYAKQNQDMQGVLDQIQVVIAKIAKEQNLNLVIAKEAVAYASNDVDITAEVIKEVKK